MHVPRPSICGLGFILALATGCGIDPEARREMAESDSILAPLFKKPTVIDAATWASDPYDADKRARGTNLLANAPFGGADAYLALYRQHIHDESAGVRAVAARGLGLHGQPDDVPRLTPLLKDKNNSVRLEVAKALQRLHNPEAVTPLIEALSPKNELEADVRAEAAGALGQYAQRRVLHALVEALEDDSLTVVTNAQASLQTLTGNDDLGDDRGAWVEWDAATNAHFTFQRKYVYPIYHRDKSWLDYVPFMPPVPNEEPGSPAGLEAAQAK